MFRTLKIVGSHQTQRKWRPPNTAICVHIGTKMHPQSCARIDRVCAVCGRWGGAYSLQLILKVEMPIAVSSAQKIDLRLQNRKNMLSRHKCGHVSHP